MNIQITKSFQLIIFSFLFIIQQNFLFSSTQPRPKYLDLPSDIVFAGKQSDQHKKLPLMIFFPFTTSDAAYFYENVKDRQPFESYVAVIPQGVTEREHYLPDFMAFIKWYEKRILTDIETAKSRFNIDPDRIYMQGYSLGGDLGWAFMIRHKEIFRGALMIGTRCSYPATQEELAWLKKNKRRFFFMIGDEDNKDRKKGMKYSYGVTDKAGLLSKYLEFPGGHSYPADETYGEAIRWVTE